MKRITQFCRAMIVALLCVTFLFLGGGISDAQGGETGEPDSYGDLPVNLKKGLNLPYVAGNTTFHESLRYNNPHHWLRIQELYPLSEFDKIRSLGFDHVRIPVDAKCVGADPVTGQINLNAITTEYNTNLAGPYPPHSTAKMNIKALRDMIRRALAEDLAVIVDLHTIVINEADFDEIKAGYFTSGPPSGREFTPDYNGLTLAKLVLRPANGVLDGNHPLAKFWTSFLPYLVNGGPTIDGPASDSPSDLPTDKVYFEIMNEPFVRFKWERYLQSEFENKNEWVLNFFWPALEDWREVQKNALTACFSIPNLPSYKFIAATALADCRDFSANPWQTKNGNWRVGEFGNQNQVPNFGDPYLPSEVGQAQSRRIIYTAHMYAPLEYTLNSGSADGDTYEWGPDYLGVGAPLFWDPVLLVTNEVIGWQTRSEGLLAIEHSVNPPVVSPWRAPVLLTEGGVSRRGVGGSFSCIDGTCTGCAFLPPPNFQEQSPLTAMRKYCDRLVWHYDVRKLTQTYGVGITFYQHLGEFALWECGQLHAANATYPAHLPIHAYPTDLKRGAINPYMRSMLFDDILRPRTGF